ncbi:zinc finger BED domain-containing protein 5-like [Temnothorax nylanderi]|uniref:zinc finger BED domain-containing protein 5-like n=1 Tax=Temnothorax nylanderi TaxID=102681 RepID=UPI003A878BBB
MMDSVSQGAIKKRRSREFQNAWLDEDIFKGWLAPHPAENKAFCIACNKTIRCCRTNLVEHSQTVRHIDNIKSCNYKTADNIDTENSLSHKDNVKRTEIKLSTFFAEHNIAFQLADHLSPLIKDTCKDPKVVQDFSLGRNKCASIVKNVTAKREIETIVKYLKTCKFSILIDESTDISDTKLMCLLVRYVSPSNKKITTQLLELLSLDARDCSANKIFEIFKKCLEEKHIPIKNIVGMASDNASVMIGRKNSFMSRLKVEVPNLVTLNCICHSSAIVASKACKKLPSSCEDLIRGVATYISGSAKRCAILGEFQDFFEIERKKILKLSETRWLCLQKCVVRLLENWEVLKNYFLLATVEDKLKSAENILQYLNDNSIKAYLLFLKYALNYFNNFNALFQSRNILIHKLYESSQQVIRQLADNFLKYDNVENISISELDNNVQHIDNIRIGPECDSFLETLSLECAQEIKLKCLDFYVTAVREMLKRLPYNDEFFKQLSFLDPKIALYKEGRNKIKYLTHIAKQVEHVNISDLAFEWDILPSSFDEQQKIQLASLQIDEMWNNILQCKNFDGKKLFPNLELLIEVVLCYPHSNAEAERIFSIVTDVKSKKRNRLCNNTLSSICVIRSSFQANNFNCINFQPDARHFELHNAQNLYNNQCTSDNA